MQEKDEELLNLYVQDQEERKQFSLLKNDAEKERMRATIQRNDAKRRELVSELIPLNNTVMRSAENYYVAAVIFSRSESLSDRKKAQGYAKKAYTLVQYRQDDFSDKVKDLYDKTNKNLLGKGLQTAQTPLTNTPMQKQLNMKTVNKRKAEEKDKSNERIEEQENTRKDRRAEENKRLKNEPKPRCYVCGREHQGPCPPR